MKNIYIIALLFFLLLLKNATAQTNYSFPLSSIISAGAAGVRLPNGTIVRATKITTGTGTHSAASGTTNPDAMGGVFTGTSFLPQYVGVTARNSFTIIETNNTQNVDNGNTNNCQNSIGFRIFFDRPTVKISFLTLDIDGNVGTNAEWISSFAFNGNTFVPYDQLVDPSITVVNLTVNLSAGHTWRNLVTGTIGATAATNLPSPYPIKRASGGSIPPDNLGGQVIFTPADPNAAVTDFYVVWGVYGITGSANVQTSGVSPIIVRVSPDFGDLPDSYKTLLASGGPSHGVVGTLGLGANNNAKPDGTPSAAANLDPDDDGISLVPPVPNTGSLSQVIPAYTLASTFFNNTGLAANYVAWIDWNNNGTFEASEAQTATTDAGATTGNVTFTWTNVPLSGTTGLANTYARIRTTTEAIAIGDAGGAFRDGEVEDYLIPFAVALPLRLSSFSGKIENQRTVLSWQMENESNPSRFEIQSSDNGTDFSTIGFVAATNGNNGYSFIDSRPAKRINYYRLKTTNGAETSYSNIIVLRNMPSDNIELSISPLPVTSMLNLYVSYAEPLSLSIYDINGQLIKKLEMNSSNFISINCSSLPAGNYFLKASDEKGKSSIIKFIKN